MYFSIFNLLLLLLCLLRSSLQTEVTLTQYYVSTANDIIYNGGMLVNDCNSVAVNTDFIICPVPSRLVNNVTLEGEQFDNTKFIGWRGEIVLAFEFPDTHITRVDIYFYNNPSEGYGIPPIKDGRYTFGNPVFDSSGIPVPVSFIGNSNFTQTDNSVTVVSVAVASDLGDLLYDFLRLTFDSSSSVINESFISEVKLFSEPDGGIPDFPPIQFLAKTQSLVYGLNNNIPLLIELSCTVINSGSFNITWTGPNGTIVDNAKTRIFSADTTRTSILRISQVSLSDNGTYSCEASYIHFEAMSVPSKTSTITLTLTGSVSHPDTVPATAGDDISLYCNFTGYLPSSFNISWRDDDGMDIPDTPDEYIIITIINGPGIANIGGDISSGVTSILTITSIEQSDIGTQYTCIMDDTDIQGTIVIMERPVPSSSTTTVMSSTILATSTPSDSSSTDIIAGSVAGVIILIIIIIVIIIVVVICVISCNKKRVNDNSYYPTDPTYTEVLKPSLPPLPERTLNDGYTIINLPENNDEMFPMKELSTSPVPSGSLLPPKKITLRPNFLQPNPMYTSRENITDGPSMAGSLAFLSEEHTDYNYNNSMFNIYASASVAPSIPSYNGTPDPMGSVYSEEDLDPSVFRSAILSENEDLYQIYRSVYSNPQPLQRSEAPVQVKEKNIRRLKDLGVGQFGEVELAHTVGLSLKHLRMSESNNDPGVSLVVAVKRLKSEADETMREAFENEIKFMARLNHENVIRLLGVCLSEKAFIMMEYMEEGDLNNYLKALEFVTVDTYPLPEGTVDVAILVYISLQVAAGMRYLADLRYIHRDLATRNVLVGQDFKIKIADFGMSQQLYSSFYYRVKGRAVLPIRWMANECFYGRFSEKTDVWAYGVLMWEVFTLCRQQPYESFTDQELIDDAIKGDERTLMSRPHTCPEEVYHVMLRCWVNNSDSRANFDEIHGLLLQIHAYNQYI